MFISQYSSNLVIPVKGYVHEAGLKLFKDPGFAWGHVSEILTRDKNLINKFDWLIVAAWGDDKRNQKVLDCFGFSNYTDWPGNPDVTIWNYHNGLIVRSSKNLTRMQCCTDVLIMLGEEEKLRRRSRNLEEYIFILTDLGNLMKK